MKRYSLFIGTVAAAFLLASCTKDATQEVGSGNAAGGDGAEEYVYLSAEVVLPSGDSFGTRSETDGPDEGDSPSDADPDTEVGQNYENNVQTCLLVITDDQYNYITHSTVSGIKMDANAEKPSFTTSAKFPRKALKALYNEGAAGTGDGLKEEYADKKFRVLAFCNNSNMLSDKINEIAKKGADGNGKFDCDENEDYTVDIAQLTGYIEETPMKAGASPVISNNIWAPDRFMMCNAENTKTINLPKQEVYWDLYTDASNPFDLCGSNAINVEDIPGVGGLSGSVTVDNEGAIKVERMAARFDYRDASDVGHNIYKVLGTLNSEAGFENQQLNFVNIKLSRISLVNMCNRQYYLKRVSADGQKTDWEIGGKEVRRPKFNYVVAPYADKMLAFGESNGHLAEICSWYNFPLFKPDAETSKDNPTANDFYDKAQWSTYNLDEVVNGKNKDNWEAAVGGKGQYTIWRYCTENTIPAAGNATDRENTLQDNAFSTGIVFKGKLNAGQYLGQTREVTDSSTGESTTVPMMTYNVQRAILASTLGLDLAGGIGDFSAAKTAAAEENPNLKNVKLFRPAGIDKTGKKAEEEEEETITWDNLTADNFAGMTSYPALYLFEGNLYAGFNEAAEYAYYDGKGGTLYQAMEDVMSHYFLHKGDAKEQLSVDGKMKEVYLFKQVADERAARSDKNNYIPLTVERFAQILGISADNDPNLEQDGAGSVKFDVENSDWTHPDAKYFDRDTFGVQWVKVTDGGADSGETNNFKHWLTSGNSAFHFTLYDASNEVDSYNSGSTGQGWGYYCYYFYWNRHNDNGIAGVMAPMEFSVVRNNVYKLSVTKISQIGHPIDPSNDPDLPDPHDDDEEQNVYLKVNVEVVPWTVRVNEIQF